MVQVWLYFVLILAVVVGVILIVCAAHGEKWSNYDPDVQ